MALASLRSQNFVPDGVPATATGTRDQAQASATSSSTALARFEFESGRGNEGTKILMVEWEDDEDGSNSATVNSRDWEVSWEGKSTVLSARDGAEGKLHRLYFLLAPGASIPPIVKLVQVGGKTIQTYPLPAIFPAELGLSARTAGKKGVLHTIWAKKRLSVLQTEIEVEMKTNGEGVGLEMAMQEKQWIEDNFGVGARITPDAQYAASPTSPKTPSGGRLSEKLKGLKLGTSSSELSQAQGHNSSAPARLSAHPLSPDMSDVAVSSFSLFHGGISRPSARVIAQNPPEHIIARQAESSGNSRINSLDAVASGKTMRNDDETEDGLFAVKMSPRSPEMTKSPFSFTGKDTAPWVKDNE